MIHKTTRSILSVLLAALLLVTSTPLTPAFADGGAVSLQSESGEGGALEPADDGKYYISTAEQLEEFAKLVNGGETTANAVLTDDINLNPKMEISEDGTVTNGSDLDQWTPIGNEDHLYTGTFNGANYTISGLYINSNSDNYQVLFGYVGTGGTVQNLTVSGSVSGNNFVGGIAGQNGGRITDCAFSGSVSGVGPVGGVVGDNRGTVENCYNTGTVTGSGGLVGGVVGYNDTGATVTNSYNTGAVSGGEEVGGVVGYTDGGRVENCYNTGTVTGSGSYVGGVVGTNGSSVENCYNTGEVSGGMYVGGVVGVNNSTVTGCYFLQGTAGSGIGDEADATGATVVKDLTALCDALKGDPWTTSPFCEHPVLKANPEGGDGTAAHPYEIKTATQLKTFRDLVDGANGNPAAWAVLMENITLNSSEEWTPIGTSSSNSYRGTFDGNGHTISGLYIKTPAAIPIIKASLAMSAVLCKTSASPAASAATGMSAALWGGTGASAMSQAAIS